jgi:chromosome segregation ATPase
MDLEQAQLALNEANGRIADLEGQVAALTGERDEVHGRAAELEAAQAALDNRLAETTDARDAAAADLAEARLALSAANGLGLTYLRRALLAEHAGQLVPELVGGDDEGTLLASIEVAKLAYTRALDAARTAIASQTVPAGAPSARGMAAAGLSPLEMIESGLRK